MERFRLDIDLDVTVDEGRVGLHGELRLDAAISLCRWFDTAGEIAVIERDDFDIADGVACARLVNLIRRILSRQETLAIYGAPQVLAHNLYRIGLLADERLVLKAIREDEAYG